MSTGSGAVPSDPAKSRMFGGLGRLSGLSFPPTLDCSNAEVPIKQSC